MVVWSLLFSAIMIATFLARPFIPQFLQDIYSLNQFQIGVFGSVTFLGSALLGICLGRIGDKRSKASAISISVILCCISFVVLTLCNNFLTLALASFLVGCSYATPMLMNAIVGSFAPEVSKGRWLSVPQSASMFAAFFAPYVGGMLYSVSPYNPFLVAIAITPILSILALTRPWKERG